MTVATVGRRRTTGVVRLVLLIAVLAVVLYPLLWMTGTALKSPQEILNNLAVWPHHVTWSNFTRGWTGMPDVTFGRFFLNSTPTAPRQGVRIGWRDSLRDAAELVTLAGAALLVSNARAVRAAWYPVVRSRSR